MSKKLVSDLPQLPEVSRKESKLFDDAKKMKGEKLPFPFNWLSLRNVVTLSHVLLIILATTAIFLSSYTSTIAGMESAVHLLAKSAMDTVQNQLLSPLYTMENINFSTEVDYRVGRLQFENTEAGILNFIHRYLGFVNTISIKDRAIDMVYIAQPESHFVGVGQLSGLPSDSLTARFMNASTYPLRMEYRVDRVCDSSNAYCTIGPNPYTFRSSSVLNITSRPFYQTALGSQTATWTRLYQFVSGYIGFTAVRPLRDDAGNLVAIAAADIKAQTLSNILKTISSSIVENCQNCCKIYLVENQSGYLVASTDPSARVDSRNGTNLQTYSKIPFLSTKIASFLSWRDDSGDTPNQMVLTDSGLVTTISDILDDERGLDFTVVLALPVDILAGQLNRAFMQTIPIVTFAVLFVTVCISVLITRKIWQPLKKITQDLLRVANLDFDKVEIPCHDTAIDISTMGPTKEEKQPKPWWKCAFIRARDLFSLKSKRTLPEHERLPLLKELRNMKFALSSMISGLKSFSKYVPLDIVSLLVRLKREAVLGVEEREMTVLFTDIADFTAMAEKMDSRDFIALMGEYFSEVSRIIIEHNGIVDKYIGDAVMAFWNAPLDVDNHAFQACSAAVRIQERLFELRRAWMIKGYPDVQTRIGINTGNCLVGNFGSRDRFNYTCLGDAVNLASRLESLNKMYQTDILVSESTFTHVQHSFLCRQADSVIVKGKSITVSIYELITFKSEASLDLVKDLALYHSAYQCIVENRIVNAIDFLDAFLQKHPTDKIAHMHKSKCEKRL